MRFHWVSGLGILVAAAGWVWLVFFTGVETGFGSERAVFNLQLGAISGQLCALGYVLIAVGAVISGFDWLRDGVVEASRMGNRPAAAEVPPRPRGPVDTRPLEERIGNYKFRALD